MKSSINPGIASMLDRFGRATFHPTAQEDRRVQRFAGIQDAFLRSEFGAVPIAERVLLSCILFDGICTQADLCLVAEQLPKVYAFENRIFIEWETPQGATDRRELGAITCKLLSELGPLPAVTDWKSPLEHAIASHYRLTKDALNNFLEDARCWLCRVLNGPLYTHVSGLIRLTALPHSTFIRKATEAILAPSKDSGTADGEDDLTARGELIEGALLGEVTSEACTIISTLKSACTPLVSNASHRCKTDALVRCLSLSKTAASVGPVSCFLVLWLVELIESGTQGTSDLAGRTIAAYVRSAAEPLLLGLRGKDLLALTGEEYFLIYDQIREATPRGSQKNMMSGIASWHHFLRDVIDVPPLPRSLYADIPDPVPRANIVWPHEFARCRGWLDQSSIDERLRTQTRVLLDLLQAVRLRTKEAMQLRLRNFHLYDDALEVEVAPLLRDGPPKSESGWRTQTVSDPEILQSLNNWIQRRRNEGATNTDLLFGDPHHPKSVYRYGMFYALSNRLLKDATGDTSVSLYTCSHTIISGWMENALMSSGTGEVNPIDEIAVAAAHFSGQTTLAHYSHRYEIPLRHHLDQALHAHGIDAAIAARWSGIRADTLRQRWARRKESRTERDQYLWSEIELARQPDAFPSVAKATDTIVPGRPAILDSRKISAFSLALSSLDDIVACNSLEAVALRNGVALDWVHSLCRAAAEVLSYLGLHAQANLLPRRMGVPPSHDEGRLALQSLCTARFGISFSRYRQPKFGPLLKYLSSSSDSMLLRSAFDAWAASRQWGYLSLESASETEDILSLLKAADVPIDHLAVSIAAQDPEQLSPEEALKASTLANRFTVRWGHPPDADFKLPRRGRPSMYLLWSSSALDRGSQSPAASVALDGLDALMITVGVHLLMSDNSGEASHG